AGYLGDVLVSAAGFGTDTAIWTFNVIPGVYRVAATWTPGTNRATNTPYMIYDGPTTRAAISVNQRLNPAGLVDADRSWSYLGGPIHVGSGTLKVRMSDNANGSVIADAIRIERVGPASPDITVAIGMSNLPVNGTVSFGTTLANVPVQKTFTVKNAGSATLNLTPIDPATLPTGYELVANLGSTSLAPGASTTFVLQLRHAVAGPVTGTFQLANNDSDENPFTFTLSGTITTVALLDDGSPGFTQAGVWTDGTGAGYLGDYRTNTRGTGADKANWTFTVAPGKYRVWTTWVPSSTRATNAPFTILDGGTLRGTVMVNQRLYPTGLYAVNRTWKQLGDFNVYTHQLQVRLTDLANGTVVADGVRIEYLGDFSRLEGTGADLATTHIPPLPVPNVSEGDISLDDDPTEGTGLPTVRNRVMVMLSDTATVEEVNALLDSIQGKIIGSMPDIKTLIVGIPNTANLTALRTAITTLEASPAVELAVQDVILEPASISGTNTLSSWVWNVPGSTDSSADSNWGMEAIRAPAMWNLTALGERKTLELRTESIYPAHIVILDGGFVTNDFGKSTHEDTAGLTILERDPTTKQFILRPSYTDDNYHGQHVAGIIGATHNRTTESLPKAIGVEGINPLGKISASTDWVGIEYGSYPLSTAKTAIPTQYIFAGILDELSAFLNFARPSTADVVNLSLCYNYYKWGNLTASGLYEPDPNTNVNFHKVVERQGKLMREIAKQYESTIFVAAAGNDSGGHYEKEIEAKWASPINYAALGPGEASPNILVVEAAKPFLGSDEYKHSFEKTDSSDVGGHVAAPGYQILSTIGPAINAYNAHSGTSMAAPHVTGLVGFLQTLARGLGTDLSPEEIKRLVTDPQYTTKCWTNESVPDGISKEVPMIDAYASVLGLDDIFPNNPIQKALVNVDDGSLDGNARVDTDDADKDDITTEAFTSVTGVNFAGIYKGDGRRGDLLNTIDMKDFRAFRDALLQVLYTYQTPREASEEQTAFRNVISLDGPLTSVKRDLNEDGLVVFPGSGQTGYMEDLYSRFDFNGSGKLDVAGRLMNPGPEGVAPFKIDPDTPVTGLNNPVGALRDIDVMAAPGVWE
ncbi:MAG: S8 family serine peptidase, partial [Gemmataceae bacterium]